MQRILTGGFVWLCGLIKVKNQVLSRNMTRLFSTRPLKSFRSLVQY